MPYTAATVPDNVPKAKARQFAAAWNNRYKACKKDGGTHDFCETSAFKVAWSAITKREDGMTDRQADRDKLKAAQKRRAAACGIAPKDGGNLTRPSQYSDCPDASASWADWTNYRYPLSPASRAINAVTRFNNTANRAKGGYTTAEWAKMGGRIAAKNAGKKYSKGEVVPVRESREASLQDRINEVRRAFYDAFEATSTDKASPSDLYVQKVYETYLLVEGQPGDEFRYYRVSYTRTAEGVITFAPRAEWLGGNLTFEAGARALSGFRAIQDKEGKPWWIGWDASAYLAGDGKFISTEALAKYADREAGKSRGPLCIAHLRGLEIGDTLISVLAGRILVEGGPFLDTPMGKAAATFYAANSEPTAMSIRWGTDPDKFRDGVFEEIDEMVERSVLPAGKEADVFTLFGASREDRDMNKWKKLWAEKVLGKEFADEIDAAVQEGEDMSGELDEQGVPSRELEGEEKSKGQEEERQEEKPAEAGVPLQQVTDLLKQFADEIALKVATEVKGILDSQQAAGRERVEFGERLDKLEGAADTRSLVDKAFDEALGKRASEDDSTKLDGRKTEDKRLLKGTVGDPKPMSVLERARLGQP